MKRSLIVFCALFLVAFTTSTFISCDPDQGEEGYVIPEDDGPESVFLDDSKFDTDQF